MALSEMLTRRRLLLGMVVACGQPVSVRAQQPRVVPCVGYVVTTRPLADLTGVEPRDPYTRELLSALTSLGWVDGQNLIVERRSAEGQFERFGSLLRGLIALGCGVIVTTGTAMTEEALRVTTTVPIVATNVDLQRMETLVASLARPGGNLTGVTGAGTRFEAKKLEVLKEAVSKARRVAVLEPKTIWDGWFGDSQRRAAAAMGLTLIFPSGRARS